MSVNATPFPGLPVLDPVGYRNRMRRPVTPVHAATIALSTCLDACCVLAFVAIGRHAHHNGDAAAGIWHTAWPFLAGLAAGLAASRYWRRPVTIVPTGIGAWVGAAGAGMLIRVVAGQGTAAAFIAVACAFLALFLIGWRALAVVARHFRLTRRRSEQRG
ncbi:MAG TPA: DUF3054 domain-containing protein [Streptosporangiaceae bacterium]|nr:DUF3054 domain-containing protein [Streptosporangiaceae bacterium]